MIKAVIFDMDGLMIDTESLHNESFKAVLEEYGVKPVPNKQGVIHISGISSKDNWERFKKQYNFEADNNELSRKKHKIHLNLLSKNVTAMPGLFKLLKELQANHIKMAIASSSIREQINLVTTRLRIADYFQAIISGEDVINGKPAPDIFLKAAEALNVRPLDCLVLEDAPSGVAAGKSAGMKVVAIPNEFNKHEDFEQADTVLSSLEKVNIDLLRSFTAIS